MKATEGSKEVAIGTVRHPLLCKWWLRTRPPVPACDEKGMFYGQELYVPWWAWPLELLHRALFGNPKFDPPEAG